LHFPRSPEHATRLSSGGAQLLPYAYELDDAPRFERFYFVTSRQTIDVNAVLESGRRLGGRSKKPLVLPDGVVLSKLVTLKKMSDGEVR
jgi:hypothetical protein